MTPTETDNPELLKISGRGALVNIQVDDSVPLQAACRTLREFLARNRRLYSDGEVIVDIGRRLLLPDEPDRIRKVIESESGLRIKEFRCDTSVLERERDRIESLITMQSTTAGRANGNGHGPGHAVHPTDQTDDNANIINDDEPQGDDRATLEPAPRAERGAVPAEVVRGTCRAGEALRFQGNVVVVGNVNPGAQIIAQGDILIFGTLRGMAHAGAGGDSTAVILAMAVANPQLRIADYIWDEGTRRPSPVRRRGEAPGSPTIARVLNRTVHVSPYLKNHAIDHGGNPNER